MRIVLTRAEKAKIYCEGSTNEYGLKFWLDNLDQLRAAYEAEKNKIKVGAK